MTEQGMPAPNVPAVTVMGTFNDPWWRLLVSLWRRTGGAQGGTTSFSGEIKPFAGSSANAPTGWLVCNGSAVSRATYADLFSAIGTVWGAGDGSTTFNLPDLRNRMLVGVGSSFALADTGGATSVTIGVTNLPAHSHAVTDAGHAHTVTDAGHAHTVTDPGHAHTVANQGSTTAGVGAGAVADTTGGSTSTEVTGLTVDSATTGVAVDSNTTGITIGNTGSGAALSTISPYAAVTYLVKT